MGRLILACLVLGSALTGCHKSSGGGDDAEGGVQLTLQENDLALLAAENPTKVRIRVYAVVNDQKDHQEGEDAIFDLVQTSATYKVTKVKLGLKEFEVTVLNAATEPVGQGSARHLVRPGLHQMAPVSVKLIPPQVRRRDLAMNLWVNVEVPGESPKTTYLDVKSILADCATSCHTDQLADGSPKQPKAGLILKDFPFQSLRHPDYSQDDIVAEVVYWMQDPTDPMPPGGPRVPDDKVALVEKWRIDGLLKFPAADQTADLATKVKLKWTLKDSGETGELEAARSSDPEHPFALNCPNFVISGSYDLTFQVFGIDGTKTYETTVSNFVLAEAGAFEQVLTIPYETPSIDIPVVVTR